MATSGLDRVSFVVRGEGGDWVFHRQWSQPEHPQSGLTYWLGLPGSNALPAKDALESALAAGYDVTADRFLLESWQPAGMQ